MVRLKRLGIAFACFALAVGLFKLATKSEPEIDGVWTRTAPGEALRVGERLEPRAVEGLCRVDPVRVRLVLDAADSVPSREVDLDCVERNDDDWSGGIESVGVGVAGLRVDKITKRLKVELRVAIPDDPGLVGRQGRVHVQGVVRYPELVGSEGVLERSLPDGASNLGYRDAELAFSFEVPVLVLGHGGRWLSRALGLAAALLGLVGVGFGFAAIPDPGQSDAEVSSS